MDKATLAASKRLETDGLSSTTHKLTIILDKPRGAVVSIDAYFTLTWSGTPGLSGELYNIALAGLPKSPHALKAVLREYCAELSKRLKLKEIDLQYICERWIVQRFEPCGYCSQLEGREVHSILDAAAKYFMRRYNIVLFT